MSEKIKKNFNPVVLSVVLCALTLALYAPVRTYQFVGYDDNDYVTHNEQVREGLSARSLAWLPHGIISGLWHPLTNFSHMLDVELFGLNAGAHHLSNVFFHMLNVLALFWILRRLTGSTGASAWVAAVFAVHPLTVDSVAWIAQRKNLLSFLFFMLTVAAYQRWLSKGGQLRLALTMLLFAAGFMAKPIVATLPAVLLLLDYWPLQTAGARGLPAWLKSLPRLLWDKAPILVVAAALSVATWGAQGKVGALVNREYFPLAARLARVPINYAFYLEKFFWPSNLAVLYPRQIGMPSAWAWGGALALLLGATALAVALARRAPHGFTGWAWFLVTLLPVIGWSGAGNTDRGDRFMYLPIAGLGIVVAWSAGALVRRWPALRTPVLCAAIISVAALAGAARVQLGCWRSTVTLFERARSVSPQGTQILETLGQAHLYEEKDADKALPPLEEARRLGSMTIGLMNDLGCAYSEKGKYIPAEECLWKALQLAGDTNRPEYALVMVPKKTKTAILLNLARVYTDTGRPAAARRMCEDALVLDPTNPVALKGLSGLGPAPPPLR